MCRQMVGLFMADSWSRASMTPVMLKKLISRSCNSVLHIATEIERPVSIRQPTLMMPVKGAGTLKIRVQTFGLTKEAFHPTPNC